MMMETEQRYFESGLALARQMTKPRSITSQIPPKKEKEFFFQKTNLGSY